MAQITILAVDDDPDILDLLEATLEDQFRIVKASTGKEAFEKIKETPPDMAILDYVLPDTTGIEICQKLRQNPVFIHMPILILTGKKEVGDKVTGLKSGADDYMVKPFSPPELIARIEMLDRRSTVSLDANPLTRLPGNISINKEIDKKLNEGDKFAVLYLDLDNFKALNDYYGFDRGDEVIKEFSNILVSASQKKGTNQDFIGHVGGDDFVIITDIDKAEIIAKDIINKLDKKMPHFYDEPDRLKGFIETKDRTGNIKKFPFVAVSVGIITNRYRCFSHVAQISSVGAELKEVAKKNPKSNYVFDRRDSEKEQSNPEE